MKIDQPVVSIVIPCHAETDYLRRTVRGAIRQQEAPRFEIIIVCDKTSADTEKAALEAMREAEAAKIECRIIKVQHGDLGPSRNSGLKEARGQFIAFCDADDVFGCHWLRDATALCQQHTGELCVAHPEYSMMFGALTFVQRHYDSHAPEQDLKDMVQFNQWSALAFGPREVFEKYPYETANHAWGYEDWHFNTRTLGDGVKHYAVKNAVHFIRMKLNDSSMSIRMGEARLAMRAMPLFDRRDLPAATVDPVPLQVLPTKIAAQALFAHYEVGEYQINPSAAAQTARLFPRQKCFDDQAWLRDELRGVQDVILVRDLVRGGAEKYAIDWARALTAAGRVVAIVETEPTRDVPSPWLQRAKKVCRVVTWDRRRRMEPNEQGYALQRALIQTGAESLFVCNAAMGWMLLFESPAVLAKRVFGASFNVVNGDDQVSSCPPFWFPRERIQEVTFISDNERHAKRIANYHEAARIEVISPMPSSDVRPMRRKKRDGRLRFLWAGRGGPEKGIMFLPSIAGATKDVAEFDVWGEIPPMPHALDNLRYRGPYDGFSSIEGEYDAFLLTSNTEGMPNVALEAVLSGLPVVATNVGDVSKIASMMCQASHMHHQETLGAIVDMVRRYCKEPVELATAHDTVLGFAAQFGDRVRKLVIE